MGGLELLLAGAFTVYVCAAVVRRSRSRWIGSDAHRSEIAVATGLGLGPGGHLSGAIGGHHASMDVGERTEVHPSRSIAEICLSQGLAPNPRHHRLAMANTGDDDFDRSFFLSGDRVAVAAFFHGRTRLRARAAMEMVPSLEIFDGVLRCGWAHGVNPPAAARRSLNALLPLAEALASTHEDLLEQLRINANSDVDPQVRMYNLLLLIAEGGDSETVTLACRDRASDSEPAIACVALAQVMSETGVSLPEEQVVGVAEDRHAMLEARRAALAILEQRGTLASIERLKRIYGTFRLSEDVERAIDWIQARCGSRGEGHLSLAESESGGSVSIADGGELSVPEE